MAATRSLSAKMSLAIAPNYAGADDLNNAYDKTAFSITQTFTNGTGASQVNRYFAKRVALTSEQTTSLNLSTNGGGEDSLGQAVALDAIKALLLKNTGNTAIEIGAAASNPWLGILKAADDVIILPAGASIFFLNPSAGGWPMTTDVNLGIVNLGAAAGQLDVVVFGIDS